MTQNLLPHLDRFAGVPLLVLGDLMLDRYLWGGVSRISPEAPVPVLKVEREDARLGGAGSVVANLAALGAQVEAVGVLGDDAPGERMLELFAELGVSTGGIVRDAAASTTQKTRVIARTQHVLRIDRDAPGVPEAALERLREAALARLDGVAAVLVSDYGRGVLDGGLCAELAREARRKGVPVLADPHRDAPFARYTGVSTLTPNRAETAKAVGVHPRDEESVRRAAHALIERFELDWCTLTLDRDGIYVLRAGEEEGTRHPARARSVYDVAGAGDMVLSVLGLAVAAGVDLDDAVDLANVAAGWEVEHLGVVPLPLSEFALELSSAAPPELRRKIMDSFDEAARRVERARAAGKEIVFTNGCFDLLHAGHVQFVQGCRAKGDYLVVGLNTDSSVRGLKGEDRPVLPLEERAMVLAGLEAVDIVVPFAEPTPLSLIERLRPDVLCKGEDYKDKVVVGRELVEGYGGRVELVRLLPGVSTTNIIAKISGE
ncbi:MAG: D-glycero-beta-D-manno-heptose 1-phosphate adenylyltransferase [Planctomycetota bacterium]|nr:MAG: D-glycero-beta-D-manno-heptose 1-phosphate adenylyltransferase [Planctomycetota bacterium]